MWFDAPRALFLLLALPFVVLLYSNRWRHVRMIRRQFDGAQRVGNPTRRLQFLIMVSLVIVGSASLIIAAAGPHIERERRQEIYKRIDVVFLLDSSLSMRARDIAPSRLDRAAQEIETFIQHNREDIGRIGLVSFSGSSVVLSYLTSDFSNIHYFLEHLTSDTQPALGTDIGAAVKSGLSVLEKEQAWDEALTSRSLVFVLISDGEDHGEAVKQAVGQASQTGVRIYAVGIGTDMGDYVPIGEQDGHTLFLVDEQGKQILATFDEGTLRWVAEATGGRYFRSRSGDDLQKNLGAILEKERVAVDVKTTIQKIPMHQWFLAVGFGTLTLRLMYRS